MLDDASATVDGDEGEDPEHATTMSAAAIHAAMTTPASIRDMETSSP